MEKDVQEKALIYNPEDLMEYWNVHFSAGLDSGYIDNSMNCISGNNSTVMGTES